MKIGHREIAPSLPPYVIAEIGVNHDGSIDRAIELVEAAARCGADAIKLQLFQADRLLSKAARLASYQKQSGQVDPFAMLRSLELNVQQMRPVVEAAHRFNLHVIITVFNVELVTDAETLNCDAYKTASPDIIHLPLIQRLMQTRRPLVLSTGAATLEEIARAAQWLGNHPHLFMHCISSYPTPDNCAALDARVAMCEISPNALGYSDHTTALDTGTLAVANGARILEKHLTYDEHANGPDHAASLNPTRFAEYVRLAQRAFVMLGDGRKSVLGIENDVRQVARQSLTSTRNLAVGEILASDDLTIKRPGTGLPPYELQCTIGRRVCRPILGDMPIMEADLE